MPRIGRRSRLKAGTVEEYVRSHRDIWPEMQAVISRAGITNYSIYRDGLDLFSYFEVDDLESAYSFLAEQPVAQRWQEAMSPFMDAESVDNPWHTLEEVFHID